MLECSLKIVLENIKQWKTNLVVNLPTDVDYVTDPLKLLASTEMLVDQTTDM